MHESVMRWVWAERAALNLTPSSRVLEVGSYDVNGSVRPLFAGCEYLGIDIRPGPGVDLVVDKRAPWDIFHLFDVIVSTEMLEHDLRPWVTLEQMALQLDNDGVLLLTCRGFDERGSFPFHEHPGDYWRFSGDGLGELVVGAGLVLDDILPDPAAPGWFLRAHREPF